MSATEPACGTYIWTGSPERYMYKCFERASIVSILDVPQFVVDASLFSKTHTTPKPTTTSSKPSEPSEVASSDSASPPDNTEAGKPGGSKSDSALAGPTSSSAPTSSTSSSNNTPVIVGSVIGGIAGLLLLLLLLLCFLRRKVKGKLGLGFTRNKKNKKEDNSSKAYHTTNLSAAAVKGRTSSSSETTTAVPMALQQQPQHHYHSQEQYHYHPQAQTGPQFQPQQLNLQQHQHQPPPPPQYRGPVGGQPVSMSYTVNEGATHAPQSSYSHSTSYENVPSTSSALGEPSRVFVGGVLPMTHSSSEKQPEQYQQPQQQSQPQPQLYYQQPQQQQGVQSQPQPVNHIHVYYAPPGQPTQQGSSVASTFSQFSSPAPEPQRSHGVVPDALGLFTQQHEQNQARDAHKDSGSSWQTQSSREQEQDDIPAYYGHSRNVSAMASTSRRDRSPSRDINGEWLGARGPGYRQSL